MTAGEIGHPTSVACPESVSLPVRRSLSAVPDGERGTARRAGRKDPAADVATCLAEDAQISACTRRAVEALLQRHRALEEEVARQRKMLQEWIVSQLTYKSLYFQYSGQTPDAPRLELVREREAVRRRIQAQLETGDPMSATAAAAPARAPAELPARPARP